MRILISGLILPALILLFSSCASLTSHRSLVDPEIAALQAARSLGDINQRDAQGRTALLLAVEKGHLEVVKWLLDHGADVDRADNDGMTPLIASEFMDSDAMVSQLLNHKPNVNTKRKDGWTALMAAAWRGRSRDLQLLLARYANINAENADHETAYVKAVQRGLKETAQDLLYRGATKVTVRLNPSPEKPEALNAAQKWALACSAILTQANGNSHFTLASVSLQETERTKDLMEKWWSVRGPNTLHGILNSLEKGSHHKTYTQYSNALDAIPLGTEDAVLLKMLPDAQAHRRMTFVRQNRAKLGKRGILGWDLCRYIYVARMGYAMGYLTREETWQLIAKVAPVIQKNFSSWKDLGENYIAGRKFWEGENTEQMQAVMELMLESKDPNNPWSQSAWNQDLAALTTSSNTPRLNTQDPTPYFDPFAFAHYRTLAEDGSLWAMRKLGQIYSVGDRVWEDDEEAFRWYEKAAKKGDIWSQFQVGVDLQYGRGVKKDLDAALEWYRRAAEQGSFEAQRELAKMLLQEKAVQQDPLRAQAWFLKAAAQNDDQALAFLGYMNEQGDGIPKSYPIAIEYYKRAVAIGNSWALTRLGWMNYNGWGVPKDVAKAVPYFNAAARSGDAEGQEALGMLYSSGEGVPIDLSYSRGWHLLAAKQGNSQAKAHLGNLMMRGQGGPKDIKQGLEWCRQAASEGDSAGQFYLGAAYMWDVGIGTDYAQALQWNKAAALQGLTGAMFNMGKHYEEGLGVPKDFEQAAVWYRKALAAGYDLATMQLMKCAEQGISASQSEINSWIEKASRSSELTTRSWLASYYATGGPLIRKDEAKARKMFEEDALRGYAEAQSQIAEMQHRGIGGPVDKASAERWYAKYVKAHGTYTFPGKPALIRRSSTALRFDLASQDFLECPSLALSCSDQDRVLYHPCSPGDPLSADIRMAVDDKNLYLWANVIQGRPPKNDKTGYLLWDADAVEFFLSTRPDLTDRSRTNRTQWDYNIFLAPTSKSGKPEVFFSDRRMAGIPVLARSNKDGYTVATAVPLAYLEDFYPKAGSRLRFDVDVEKGGPDGHRMRKILWNSTTDDVDNPDSWGVAEIR